MISLWHVKGVVYCPCDEDSHIFMIVNPVTFKPCQKSDKMEPKQMKTGAQDVFALCVAQVSFPESTDLLPKINSSLVFTQEA